MESNRVSLLLNPPDMEQVVDMEGSDESDDDHRSRLERTIDKIGMGSYQWALLALCGLGWAADNMWIQAIAIILPRVQDHYSVSTHWIGVLSACLFAGMMIGAVGWGTCSDLLGRSAAFNLTLCFTTIFGLIASVINSFPGLCICLFFLGTAVGGSMPTDGTLLLENLPKKKHYLLTFLSVFFSVGAVVSALLGIIIIPSQSCSSRPDLTKPCDVDTENKGWKILLMVLAGVTLIMFLCRIVLFRLHESPRYLVHAGRPQEAALVLTKISQFNGDEIEVEVEDVNDVAICSSQDERGDITRPTTVYDAIGEMDTPPLEGHAYTPIATDIRPSDALLNPTPPNGRSRQRRSASEVSTASRKSIPPRSRVLRALPRWIRKPLQSWFNRIAMLLKDDLRRTTLLVWGIWFSMSLAYTMFNVFLPKLLESRTHQATEGVIASEAEEGSREPERTKKLGDAMWEVVVFTLGGCPGAVVGAFLIESRLGRRLTLAISTFTTALFCIAFVRVSGRLWLMVAEIGISLSANTMWAVLYGMTPEIFSTEVRGTACGTASALSRIGGIMAPLIGGSLLAIDSSLPVYTSVATFILATIGVLALHESGPDTSNRSSDSVDFAH